MDIIGKILAMILVILVCVLIVPFIWTIGVIIIIGLIVGDVAVTYKIKKK